MDGPLSKEELHRRALELLDVENLEGPELCRAYLNASKLVRYDNPQLMVDFAAQAVDLAQSLDLERYGHREVADCHFLALIELGNAYRVADRHKEAGSTLGEALAVWYQGSRDELLRARLHDYQASLAADKRHFTEAFTALDTVYSIYSRLGEDHLAGRALISKGIYQGYEGNYTEAIRLLREGLAKIDRERDLALALSAVQSQASFLVMLGRFRDARKLMWGESFPKELMGARINWLKVRWLEAQIDAGFGENQRAEAGLLEVTRGFEKEKLYYKAALAGLDLVHLWYRQGRIDHVREVVAGLVKIFLSYNVDREALLALGLLDSALKEGIEAGAILDRVTDFIRRAETQPGMKFDDWF